MEDALILALNTEGAINQGMQVAFRSWKSQGGDLHLQNLQKDDSPAHTLILEF